MTTTTPVAILMPVVPAGLRPGEPVTLVTEWFGRDWVPDERRVRESVVREVRDGRYVYLVHTADGHGIEPGTYVSFICGRLFYCTHTLYRKAV
jgi:hypothetical protein